MINMCGNFYSLVLISSVFSSARPALESSFAAFSLASRCLSSMAMPVTDIITTSAPQTPIAFGHMPMKKIYSTTPLCYMLCHFHTGDPSKS